MIEVAIWVDLCSNEATVEMYRVSYPAHQRMSKCRMYGLPDVENHTHTTSILNGRSNISRGLLRMS